MNTAKPEWWEDFFTGLCVDFVRPALRDDERTRAEADFIARVLQLTPPARVLDVPCGMGRHSLELAARGYPVTGVDLTLPFLEEAQRAAAEQQLEVMWEHRDMRNLPWKGEFDGAFCFGGSFGYFDEESNAEFLRAMSRSLKPGARFLVDTHVAETLLPVFRERDWQRMGDTLVITETRYDHIHGRVETEWTFVREGDMAKRPSSIRLYTYRELCQLLEEVGLTDWEGYGSLNREPFGLGSRRLYLVATKSSLSAGQKGTVKP